MTFNPAARYTQRESVTLAFLAALQLLPPRQRAILILCDVLDWHASEVALVLDMTISAVNSALHRARSTMNKSYTTHTPALTVDKQLRAILNRYVEAWESGDVQTLIGLLKENVRFTMPPMPSWYANREAVRVHADSMFHAGGHNQWRLVQTSANNQIAFACYLREATDDGYYAHALQVITFEDEQMSQIQMFILPYIFPQFGLPMQLPK